MNPAIPIYISALFVGLVLSLFYFLMNGFKYALNRVNYPEEKKRKLFLAVPIIVTLWLGFLAVLGVNGFFTDFSSTPPRFAVQVIPPTIVILLLVFSNVLNPLLMKLHPRKLINLQLFRVVMEIILWLLYLENVIPVQMSFEGRNYDILAGVTAPLLTLVAFKGNRYYPWLGLVWNIAGLALLMNIVFVSILSAPGPFHSFMNEPSNTLIAYYPYVWLPGFVVPFALFLHLASIKQLVLKIRSQKKMEGSLS